MERIILHCTYTCKPGMAPAFVKALKDSGAQDKVRAEDGCLQYDYHLSCEVPDTVVLLEQWRDAAALEAHQRQPHMDTIRSLKADYVQDFQLERFEAGAAQ